MSRLRATEPIEVSIGDCECPDTPHQDGDKAWLRPRVRPDAAWAATSLLTAGLDKEELMRALTPIFLGEVLRWNLLTEDTIDGQRVVDVIPCDVDTMMSGALDWEETIKPILDAAADLYGPQVMRPLQKATSKRSRSGRTAASTSATSAST